MIQNTLRIPRMKYCAILDSSQSNNASWKSMKEILQTKVTTKSKYQKVVLTKLATLMLKAKLPNAIADVRKWMTCFSSLKSLSHRISGRYSRKGGGL